jgi:predicted peptidase
MAQQEHLFETASGEAMSYLLHLPEPGARREGALVPLILFLHGAGESGSDPALLRRQGLPLLVEERPDFPFAVLSPQSRGQWGVDLAAVGLLLDAVLSEPREGLCLDPERVYLTGISMGGFGAWHLGTVLPEAFAAVVPICGYGPARLGYPARVCLLAEVPVWAFHGASDPVVPARASVELVEALKACGGDALLTLYPGVGHDSWTRTYANPALYDWLLSKNRSRTGPKAV